MAARKDDASANDNAGGGARRRASEAYQAARERTYSAYEAARERASGVGRQAADATRQAADQAAVYPVGAVIGGLVVGALLGALVPRTRRESELLGPTGRKLTQAARDAAEKGVETTRDKVDQVVGEVVTRAGTAVVEAVGGKE